MIDQEILARIRKCFALSRSSNEHEAAVALEKARRLMHEYGLTDADVALAEIEEATARASRTVRPLRWEAVLCLTVCRAIGVDSFIDYAGDRTFVGRGPGPEIAAYAFTVLFRRLKAARAEYIRTHLRRCRPGRKRQRADIFCEAWALAVFRRVAALMPERPEDPIVHQYLAKRHPGLQAVNARGAKLGGRAAWDDFGRGHHAGQQVELNSAVNGGSQQLALT